MHGNMNAGFRNTHLQWRSTAQDTYKHHAMKRKHREHMNKDDHFHRKKDAMVNYTEEMMKNLVMIAKK